jgi:hypothetical protein
MLSLNVSFYYLMFDLFSVFNISFIYFYCLGPPFFIYHGNPTKLVTLV